MKRNIKTGDIFICIGTSKISNIIQRATGSVYSHTSQSVWIDDDLFMIEAQKEGVILLPFAVWVRKYNYDYTIFRDPFCYDEKNWTKNAFRYLGKPYDKKGLAHGLFKNAFKIIVEKFTSRTVAEDMPLKYRNNGYFWCSEFTMKLIGVKNPEDYSPKMVYKYCLRNNFIKIYDK